MSCSNSKLTNRLSPIHHYYTILVHWQCYYFVDLQFELACPSAPKSRPVSHPTQPSVCSRHINRSAGADTLIVSGHSQDPARGRWKTGDRHAVDPGIPFPPEQHLRWRSTGHALAPPLLFTNLLYTPPALRAGIQTSKLTPCNHQSVITTLIGSRESASVKDFRLLPQPRAQGFGNLPL